MAALCCAWWPGESFNKNRPRCKKLAVCLLTFTRRLNIFPKHGSAVKWSFLGKLLPGKDRNKNLDICFMNTAMTATFAQPVPFFYGFFYFGFTKTCGGVLA